MRIRSELVVAMRWRSALSTIYYDIQFKFKLLQYFLATCYCMLYDVASNTFSSFSFARGQIGKHSPAPQLEPRLLSAP